MQKPSFKTKFRYLNWLVIFITIFLYPASSLLIAQTTDTNINSNANENSNSNTNTNVNVNESVRELPAESVIELNFQIDQKKQAIDELQKKRDHYNENIAIKQKEAKTLNNQLAEIDDQISKTNVDIEITQAEIDKLALEINEVNLKIDEKQKEISSQKDRLAEFIRTIYQENRKSKLEVLMANDSFSQYLNYVKYLQDIESGAKDVLDDLQSLKAQLQSDQNQLTAKKKEAEDKNKQLEGTRTSLTEQESYKNNLLVETKDSEKTFQSLLGDIEKEVAATTSELSGLEARARAKLKGTDDYTKLGDAKLAWPVDSSVGISAYFHDPDYIFRKYFEHPAIDLRVSQGTAVAAAADGIIGRAKNAGLGYSYVMIIHNDKISTVYGHLSAIYVEEDQFVKKGDIIGLSGGIPGTTGAGRLTTGAHLHFEVRVDGLPVNPLEYLP